MGKDKYKKNYFLFPMHKNSKNNDFEVEMFFSTHKIHRFLSDYIQKS
jgi:hypothetical protein